MRMGSAVVALAVVVALLAGCGGGNGETETAEGTTAPSKASLAPPKELRVTLDSVAGAENASILTAVNRGYFSEADLNSWANAPALPNRPVAYVAHGLDDIGVAQEPQVVIAKEKGMPIVAIGSLIAQPIAAMIWLKGSNIHRVSDLKGKTIAVPGITYQERFLRAILTQAGLTPEDVKIKRVGYDLVPALISGRADAIFGGSSNLEGTELEARGENPVVTPVRELGIPNYDELVVIARSDLVAKDPQSIRRFMAAVARGTTTAVNDPQAVVNAIEEADASNSNREMTEAEVAATAPLLSKDGYMSPDRASRLVDWMYEQGLIKRKIPVSALLTNKYLP